jgi:hypothetical protein
VGCGRGAECEARGSREPRGTHRRRGGVHWPRARVRKRSAHGGEVWCVHGTGAKRGVETKGGRRVRTKRQHAGAWAEGARGGCRNHGVRALERGESWG